MTARRDNLSQPGPPRRPGSVSAGDLAARVIRGPRKDGRWYWRCDHRVGGERVTMWTGWASREEAIKALAELVSTGESPKAAADAATVRDLLELYVGAATERGDLSPRTVIMRRMCGDRLCGDVQLRATRLDRLDARALERHRDQRLRSGNAASTVHLDLSTLGSAWRWGRDLGITPDHELRMPRVRVPQVDRFRPSREEIDKVIGWLRKERSGSPWAARMVEVYARTGARLSELSRLRWADLRGRFLHVVGKGAPRSIPLPLDVAADLEARRGAPDARLWGPTPSSIGSILSVYLVSASAALGLAGVCSTHAIRRYVVDLHRRQGVHPKVSAELLGHSPATQAKYYAATTSTELAEAIDRLNAPPDKRKPRGQVLRLTHRSGAQTAGNVQRTPALRASESRTR